MSRGRLNELAQVLAADIGWRGIAGPDGETPSCQGHETALEATRRGLAPRGMITIRAFVERARPRSRVVRHERGGGEQVRFVAAEVSGRELTLLRASASESEARAAVMVAWL